MHTVYKYEKLINTILNNQYIFNLLVSTYLLAVPVRKRDFGLDGVDARNMNGTPVFYDEMSHYLGDMPIIRKMRTVSGDKSGLGSSSIFRLFFSSVISCDRVTLILQADIAPVTHKLSISLVYIAEDYYIISETAACAANCEGDI